MVHECATTVAPTNTRDGKSRSHRKPHHLTSSVPDVKTATLTSSVRHVCSDSVSVVPLTAGTAEDSSVWIAVPTTTVRHQEDHDHGSPRYGNMSLTPHVETTLLKKVCLAYRRNQSSCPTVRT